MITNLRKKPKIELVKDLETSRKAYMELKFDFSLGKLKDLSKIRKAKKVVAQILTLLKEKETLESLKK